jgi:hypothetical protein
MKKAKSASIVGVYPGAGEPSWRNRIVGYGEQAPDQLVANDKNWRVHNTAQQNALRGVLNEVGVVQNVIVNQRSGKIVDGHLRVALAITDRQPTVPITYVDLSDDEEKLILATLDPLSAMAGTDQALLSGLCAELPTVSDAALRAMLATLSSPPSTPNASLAERFIVPPFSVLDARQGYWQDRKAAWLALGIQSELGRGGDDLLGLAPAEGARARWKSAPGV